MKSTNVAFVTTCKDKISSAKTLILGKTIHWDSTWQNIHFLLFFKFVRRSIIFFVWVKEPPDEFTVTIIAEAGTNLEATIPS